VFRLPPRRAAVLTGNLGEGGFEILVLCGSRTRLAIVRLSIEAAKVAGTRRQLLTGLRLIAFIFLSRCASTFMT